LIDTHAHRFLCDTHTGQVGAPRRR
jgi:hypothetical protein